MNIPTKNKAMSYILKIITFMSAFIGTYMSAAEGRHSFMGGKRVFMFFTIQSNIAIALICLIGLFMLLGNMKIKDWWYVLKFVGTVSITLTGIVFCFVLAPTLGKFAWSIPNILTHVIVPLAAVLDFFVTGMFGNVSKKDVIYVVIPPLLYAIYAGIGYVKGWQFAEGINYPYFFLNWGSLAGAFGFTKGLPLMGTVWWILALLLFLLAVGHLYLKIVSILKRNRESRLHSKVMK